MAQHDPQATARLVGTVAPYTSYLFSLSPSPSVCCPASAASIPSIAIEAERKRRGHHGEQRVKDREGRLSPRIRQGVLRPFEEIRQGWFLLMDLCALLLLELLTWCSAFIF